MTVVARRVASIPARLASETWFRIVDLVAPTNVEARTELMRVTGIASSLITREVMKDSAIVVVGVGPRVRLYCLYGDGAIEGASVNEAPLPRSPAESNTWTLSLPCPADDLNWVRSSLEALSSRITARDMDKTALLEADDELASAEPTIDVESFLRP